MKKLMTILFVISTFSEYSTCQSSEYLRFFDSKWEVVDKLRKVSYIESISVESGLFHVKIFNNAGKLLMNGKFSSIDPRIPNGKFEFYSISNKYDKCIGNYQNGEIAGQWKIFLGDSVKILDYDSINIYQNKELDFDKYSSGVFITYENYPSFRGRDPSVSFREYIAEEIFYPPFEDLFHITGRVIIQFVVDTDGNACKPKIVKNVNASFDKEALRILINSPKWDPVDRIEMLTFPFGFDHE